MSFQGLTPQKFSRIPAVLKAVENPRASKSVLNYMCGCDVSDPEAKKGLYADGCCTRWEFVSAIKDPKWGSFTAVW